MKANRTFRDALWLASACVVLLSGCASYVSTQVTAFSDWSGSDATRTYVHARPGRAEQPGADDLREHRR